MLVDYEKVTSTAQLRINALLTQLSNCDTTIKTRFREHTNAFRELESELSQGRHSKKCTWLTESRFFSAIQMETLIRQTLGQTLSNWTAELGKLEDNRSECLRTNMLKFMQLQSENFIKLDQTDEVSRLLESVSTQFPEQRFLSPEEIELVTMVNGDPDPFQSLIQWVPKQGPKMPLTVKTGYLEKETGVFREWQRYFVVLTNTHFLHFFHTGDLESFPEPLLSVFLSRYKVFVSGDDFVFDLVETKNTGLLSLMSSAGLHTLKAESAEVMNEWMQSLAQYML
jgi:hypothetical protein